MERRSGLVVEVVAPVKTPEAGAADRMQAFAGLPVAGLPVDVVAAGAAVVRNQAGLLRRVREPLVVVGAPVAGVQGLLQRRAPECQVAAERVTAALVAVLPATGAGSGPRPGHELGGSVHEMGAPGYELGALVPQEESLRALALVSRIQTKCFPHRCGQSILWHEEQ